MLANYDAWKLRAPADEPSFDPEHDGDCQCSECDPDLVADMRLEANA